MKKLMRLVACLSLAACAVGVAIGAVVGNITAPVGGDRIELHDQQGICPNNSKEAVYFVSDPRYPSPTVQGCWMVANGNVYMGFLDGDKLTLPIDAFKWAPGTRPMRFPM